MMMLKECNYSNYSDEEVVRMYHKDAGMASEILVEKYGNFVRYVVSTYFPTYRNCEDMFQSGVEGLLKAIRTYDSDKGRFTTYCMPYVKKECSRQARFYSGEKSEYYGAVHNTVKKAISDLEKFGKEVTVEAVMKKTGLSRKVVKREMDVDYTTVSYESLADIEPACAQKNSVDEILCGTVLSPYEQKIVKMRAVNGDSFDKIAGKFGKAKYVVEQDYKEALDKLREHVE